MTEREATNVTGLAELIIKVATLLVSTTWESRENDLGWVVRSLGEFLEVDAAFLRRNDHARGLSVREAQWPRVVGGEPEALSEVSFSFDELLFASKDLRTVHLLRPEDHIEKYVNLINGTDFPTMGGIVMPLLVGDSTWGVLGFLTKADRTWSKEELGVLEATTAMLAQLFSRLSDEVVLQHSANNDALTGLGNRRALVRELERRIGTGQKVAVLLFDLDRFKVVNDFLGHGNGDRLLVAVAERVRAVIRSCDFAARLGGDEFVLVLDDGPGTGAVRAITQRLQQALGEPFVIAGRSIRHRASVGITLADGSGALALLERADIAMYEAKSAGRNRVRVFDEELATRIRERSQMELDLSEAISGGELEMWYQPEFFLGETGTMIAAEALVRWRHPVRGLLQAAQFIGAAEESGVIAEIDRWVLAEALRQWGLWTKEGIVGGLTLRMNLSPASFQTSDLFEYVQTLLSDNALTPSSLCIEVTERALMQDPEAAAYALGLLRGIGVTVAIDDFGTGFSSMTELKRLPADLLKLDMGFVGGITQDPHDHAIVESIIRLAHSLDMDVVAEGVENTAVAEELVKLGCVRAQGHLFSPALSAEEFAEFNNAELLEITQLATAQLVGR